MMADGYNFYQYIQQLQAMATAQQAKIDELKKEVHQLREEVNNLKQKSMTTKIEYKFDQLKIERLEGTLNIGLTSGADEKGLVDDFTVNGKTLAGEDSVDQVIDDAFNQISSQVDQYLNSAGLEDLMQFEQQYGHPLDGPYRQFILTDIKKQIPNRILEYMKHLNRNDEDFVSSIVEKVKVDIKTGLENFIRNLRNNSTGGEDDELSGDKS